MAVEQTECMQRIMILSWLCTTRPQNKTSTESCKTMDGRSQDVNGHERNERLWTESVIRRTIDMVSDCNSTDWTNGLSLEKQKIHVIYSLRELIHKERTL